MKKTTPTETVRNDKEPILVNLMLFCELLHRMGLKFGAGNLIDLVPVSYTHLTLPTKA